MEKPFPAYKGADPYVFVCYAHEDAAIVYPEIQFLYDSGVNIWYDEGISPGEEWSEELGRAIQGATRFLFFVTPNSVSSRHCRNELHFAQNHETPLLAVHLRDTELPAGIELTLGANQAIFLQGNADREKLLNALPTKPESGAGQSRHADPSPARTAKATLWFLAGSIALLLVAGISLWWLSHETSVKPPFDRSVVVAPFSVLGSEPRLEVYADGITDEVEGLLAGYQELRTVLAGAATGLTSPDDVPPASYSVSGMLQGNADTVSVRAKMTRMTDGLLVWSAKLEQPVVDVANGQSELALRIARAVRLELVKDHECESIRKRSRSAEAAKLVCEGLAENYRATQGRGSDPQIVFANAQQAVALDPSLVEGYHLLAIGYMLRSSYGQIPWQEAYPPAQEALDVALKLDPDNASTLFWKGTVESVFGLNWELAESYIDQAIALDPLHPQAHSFHVAKAYTALGRGEVSLALDHCQRALNLYDGNGRAYVECARILNSAGQPREATRIAKIGLELLPTGPWPALLMAEVIFAASTEGDLDSTNRELDDTLARIEPQWKMLLADSLAMAGRIDEAEQSLAQLESASPSLLTFEVWANLGLGRLDRAFELMPSTIDLREGMFLTGLRSHPRYDPMRNDPRWEAVLDYLRQQEAQGY